MTTIQNTSRLGIINAEPISRVDEYDDISGFAEIQTNLCMEVYLPVTPGAPGTCTLASINLAQFSCKDQIEYEKELQKTTKHTRTLLLCINSREICHTSWASYAIIKYCPFGIGVQNETLGWLHIATESSLLEFIEYTRRMIWYTSRHAHSDEHLIFTLPSFSPPFHYTTVQMPATKTSIKAGASPACRNTLKVFVTNRAITEEFEPFLVEYIHANPNKKKSLTWDTEELHDLAAQTNLASILQQNMDQGYSVHYRCAVFPDVEQETLLQIIMDGYKKKLWTV